MVALASTRGAKFGLFASHRGDTRMDPCRRHAPAHRPVGFIGNEGLNLLKLATIAVWIDSLLNTPSQRDSGR